MADNDVILKEIFDAIKNLNQIKNLVEKTDLKTTSILESLNRQEDTIKNHISEIAAIKNEITHIKEDIRCMKIDIKANELNNNNIYLKLRHLEEKEDRSRKFRLKIINTFKSMVANRYTIALYTSIILAIIYIVAKLIITFTGNYFGIEHEIIDSFHNELDNR